MDASTRPLYNNDKIFMGALTSSSLYGIKSIYIFFLSFVAIYVIYGNIPTNWYHIFFSQTLAVVGAAKGGLWHLDISYGFLLALWIMYLISSIFSLLTIFTVWGEERTRKGVRYMVKYLLVFESWLRNQKPPFQQEV